MHWACRKRLSKPPSTTIICVAPRHHQEYVRYHLRCQHARWRHIEWQAQDQPTLSAEICSPEGTVQPLATCHRQAGQRTAGSLAKARSALAAVTGFFSWVEARMPRRMLISSFSRRTRPNRRRNLGNRRPGWAGLKKPVSVMTRSRWRITPRFYRWLPPVEANGVVT